MNLADLQVQVHPGPGIVAHFGTAVVVTADDSSHLDFVEALLLSVESSCATTVPAPGRQLIRKLAGLVTASEPDAVASFGVVATAEEGLAVMLCGSVDANIDGTPAGSEHLSGLDVATWVDRVVRQCSGLSVFTGTASTAPADPHLDLRAGSVPGSGFTLARRAERDSQAGDSESAGAAVSASSPVRMAPPPPPPEPVAAQAAPAPSLSAASAVGEARVPDAGPVASSERERPLTKFVSVALDEPLDPAELEPLPIATAAGGTEPAADDAGDDVDQVQGIVCSRGHFIDPRARFCAVCGIAMVHQTHNLVWGARPSLGVLVLDSGASFVVDHDYVIGREPEISEHVHSGEARPITVDDPDLQISRVHARVLLRDWDVRIEDSGSANGTRILLPGSDDWASLVPGEPVTIGPGTRISLGPRELVFDSHFQGA